MRRLTAPAIVLGILLALAVAFSATSAPLLRAVVVPTCATPTGTMTVAKLYAYDRCRFDRLEALGENQHEPAPPAPTVTVTPTPTVTVTPTPTPTGFPIAATTGVPAGWTPAQTINGDHRITTAGATVTDLRINGNLIIDAANVTVRRVLIVGGVINNWPGTTCHNGLVVEDTTIRRGTTTTDSGTPALGDGGFTARNVLIDGTAEGFRVGGSPNCGPVTITDSYAKVTAPDVCNDWHGDGIQGYGGAALTVRNTVLVLEERGNCGGTAAFFVPQNQGNTTVDIDGLIVDGGGYPFRLGVPGTVSNLNVVNESWGYGTHDVVCSAVSTWSARVVTLDSGGQPIPVRTLPC